MSDHIPSERAWAATAIAELHREAARSADTHLLHMRFAGFPGIDFYFKDEAAHPTGSLKHRLARSLFLYALCNGRLREGQAVVDASSGSTAISEAWFARLLGLPFVAAALAWHRMLGAVAWVRKHQLWVLRLGGGLLVAVGLLLVTGTWDLLVAWLRAFFPDITVAI